MLILSCRFLRYSHLNAIIEMLVLISGSEANSPCGFANLIGDKRSSFFVRVLDELEVL